MGGTQMSSMDSKHEFGFVVPLLLVEFVQLVPVVWQYDMKMGLLNLLMFSTTQLSNNWLKHNQPVTVDDTNCVTILCVAELMFIAVSSQQDFNSINLLFLNAARSC